MTHVASTRYLELGPEKNNHTRNRDRFSHSWQTAGLSEKTPSDCPLDLNGEFPWPDGRFEVVYSSHVLEHLAAPRSFLKNCFRVLEPHGLIRIVVPSMPFVIDRYVKGKASLDQVLEWARDYRPMKHRDGYDEIKIVSLLESAGFEWVRTLKPNKSIMPEMRDPYFSTRPNKSIRCEGRKPCLK